MYCKFFSEKDIGEVLQTNTVFSNVSRGEYPKKDALWMAFETDDQTEICREILAKGILQVSERDRRSNHESKLKEISSMISECINPATKLPYSVTTIREAMREIRNSISSNRTDLFGNLIKGLISIEEAKWRVKIVIANDEDTRMLKKEISNLLASKESETWNKDVVVITALIYPENYKLIKQIQRNGGCTFKVLDLKHVEIDF